jgi:hypothetical protein
MSFGARSSCGLLLCCSCIQVQLFVRVPKQKNQDLTGAPCAQSTICTVIFYTALDL